ncbi:inorganic pyrophosphatase [bacterium]|nr:inorganic pyrophosphatase [bacterium]MCI0605754.1 inorganic pyrophosphatase [bacterium]
MNSKAHPWHGVSPGDQAPEMVTAYIEIVPTDTIKYEIDKISGLLKVDRPQKFSNICPTLYGFIPQTYCGDSVAELTMQRTGRAGLKGDGDPMDICVLAEKAIPRGDILLTAVPIGGLRMIDRNDVDDKIVAVLKDDAVYGNVREIQECSPGLIQRLKHYFLTYKQSPDEEQRAVEITHVYGRAEAHDVIVRSFADYRLKFP